MSDFWNERYAKNEYAYGIQPNQFLVESISKLPKNGKILFPAEGEGRNAVFAAKNGFEVFAFDTSNEGKKKADKLADDNNIKIDYRVGILDNLNFTAASFDGVVFIYSHFPKAIRATIHQQIEQLLKPNGVIIFEAFSKEQLQYPSGGPKNIEMLFSEEEVTEQFQNIEFDFVKTEIIELSEGPFHQGKGSVVRFTGKKK
ncbi:Methyltransferase domain-containing protein [Flavobacterium micromati]|jgi:SAM-dependent methyltransferase|uniref:Methyltransferase domain-containing protein n=1 Tax=Flavobacterium micromati TaxID=229205 RepID=A0A1M5P4X0_9FLAO|nr:class I SAM-dependent methyltransferase [Flavobacterium micromati]MCL6462629.1 class I SAM-dependent methyltransferase [Flavobacterium micromati]SHG96792.1 Methyltransferase domain-containing protein [Flavobacterium micromati]